jgi:hypothetical protein
METAIKQRPTTLKVLLVLSLISLSFQLFVQVTNAFNGPMTAEELREEKLEMMSGLTEETAALMEGTVSEMMQLVDIGNDNFYLISTVSLLSIVIGLAAI